jgi:anti-anti-sigma factor
MAGTRTLRPKGDLDLASVEGLRPRWFALAAERPEAIVIDLRDVQFLDSAALSLFVSLLKRQRQHGGELLLRGASERVTRLLRLTELDQVFRDAGLAADPDPTAMTRP